MLGRMRNPCAKGKRVKRLTGLWCKSLDLIKLRFDPEKNLCSVEKLSLISCHNRELVGNAHCSTLPVISPRAKSDGCTRFSTSPKKIMSSCWKRRRTKCLWRSLYNRTYMTCQFNPARLTQRPRSETGKMKLYEFNEIPPSG